jgi:hypothetical protein
MVFLVRTQWTRALRGCSFALSNGNIYANKTNHRNHPVLCKHRLSDFMHIHKVTGDLTIYSITKQVILDLRYKSTVKNTMYAGITYYINTINKK